MDYSGTHLKIKNSNFPSDHHVHKVGHWKSNQNDLFTKSSIKYKISCNRNVFSFWLFSLKKGSVIKGLKILFRRWIRLGDLMYSMEIKANNAVLYTWKLLRE